MRSVQALAIRRAAFAAAGLAATVAAHGVATGGLGLSRWAPLVWGAVVGAAAVVGRRRGAYLVRGACATLLLMLTVQAALHAVATAAPWAVGFAVHHHGPALTVGGALAHVSAALLLTVLVVHADRLLAAAVAAGRAVAGWLAPRRPAARRPCVRVGPADAAAVGRRHTARPAVRGPPPVASTAI